MREISMRIANRLGPLFNYDLSSLSPNEKLAEHKDLNYDSMSVMECVVLIQDEFDINIDFVSDDVRHTFATLENIASMVRRKLDDKARLANTQLGF